MSVVTCGVSHYRLQDVKYLDTILAVPHRGNWSWHDHRPVVTGTIMTTTELASFPCYAESERCAATQRAFEPGAAAKKWEMPPAPTWRL